MLEGNEGAVERRAVPDTSDPGLLDFIARHRVSDLPAEPEFLLRLTRGPASVLDLRVGGERALVAVLTDACDNAANSAEMVVLAFRGATLPGPAFALALDAAEQEASRGPRTSLEVGLVPAVLAHEPLLRARGFRERYAMVRMERADASADMATLAPGLRWADLTAATYLDSHDLIRAAFQGLPGVSFAPAEQGRERALSKMPPDRLLFDDAGMAGFASVYA